MKRIMAIILTALMLFSAAGAEQILQSDYTDTPTAPTQDSVLALSAGEGLTAECLPPDEGLIALLQDVYRFVWEEKNRPARYYDEETQKKLAELAKCNIDALHMTEAMNVTLGGETEETVTLRMLLDVDYMPGQLVLPVMGVKTDDGYVWYPYRGRVEQLGEILWDVPAEEWTALAAQPVVLHVLSDRIGPRGKVIRREENGEEIWQIFSKDSGDVIRTRTWHTVTGGEITDDFAVTVVPLTADMEQEVARIGAFLAEEKPLLDWFPQAQQDEAKLILPEGVDAAELVAYDIFALTCENYKDTWGDVNVEMELTADYDPEKAMLVLAGFPEKDAEEAPFVTWYVLQAETLPATPLAEIGLKQLNLIRMMQEPMMLIVISQPLDAE